MPRTDYAALTDAEREFLPHLLEIQETLPSPVASGKTDIWLEAGMDQRTLAMIVVTGLASNITMPVSGIETADKGAKSARAKVMTSEELIERGKQLRAEIDRTYKRLSSASAIKNQGMGRNFITDVVANYIPVGISFDNAEAILRGAGFTVHPRVPNPHLSNLYPQKYDVIATIDKYVPSSLGKTSVTVSLRPRIPNDYSSVSGLSAEITRSPP